MNVTKITLIALALTTLSCTVSMMYVFMSGDAGGGDVQALLRLQTIAIPIAIVIVAVEYVRSSARDIWNATPAWAVIAILLVNLLVGIGELALLLRVRLSGEPALWYEHAPLACALVCSLAFCALYARAYPSTAGSASGVGRW